MRERARARSRQVWMIRYMRQTDRQAGRYSGSVSTGAEQEQQYIQASSTTQAHAGSRHGTAPGRGGVHPGKTQTVV